MNTFDINTNDLFGSASTASASSTFGSKPAPFSTKSATGKTALGLGSPSVPSSMTSKPMSNPAQTSAWNLGEKRTGKKSSKPFFAIIKIAWNNADLTDDERYALMKNVKKLPLSEASVIRAQYAENMRRAVEANGEVILNSRPQQTQKAQLELFISAVTKLRSKATDANALKWGTVLQLDFFQSIKDPAWQEFQKVSPQNREMLMNCMIYNVFDLKQGMALMEIRWKAFAGLLKALNEMGITGTVRQPGYEIRPGQKVVSGFIEFDLDNVKIPHIDLDSLEGKMSLPEVLKAGFNSDNVSFYLAGSNCTNWYSLKQASDLRQNKGDATYVQKASLAIMKKMASVIELASMRDMIEGKKLNLDPKGIFCQTFFMAKAFCGATLRGINAQLYGVSGGADTRSGLYSAGTNGVPDFESFDF